MIMHYKIKYTCTGRWSKSAQNLTQCILYKISCLFLFSSSFFFSRSIRYNISFRNKILNRFKLIVYYHHQYYVLYVKEITKKNQQNKTSDGTKEET